MQVLYLIRHGETDYNRDGRIQGATESKLSDLGREQARRVGKRIEGAGIKVAVASPRIRAVETCRIALGSSLEYTTRDGIQEIHLGAWEGKRAEELKESFPEDVRLWFRRPSRVRIAGAETIRRFRARVTREMNAIRDEHGDVTMAVFTHGGVICTYLTSLLGMKLDDIWRFKIRNGSVTRVIFPQDRPRIDLLGDVHHLDGALREIPDASFRMFP